MRLANTLRSRLVEFVNFTRLSAVPGVKNNLRSATGEKHSFLVA
jgi:hypothetical protein